MSVGALAAVSSSGAAPPPRYIYYDVAFVTMTGKGVVTSTPRGIRCPSVCRKRWVRGTHVDLHGQAAPGWRFAGFSSKWCGEKTVRCGFDLVSPHDCSGGACPLGSFGVIADFVRIGSEGGASP